VIGESVGEYKIIAALGMGSVGETFTAEHATTGAKAVVEVMAAQLAATPEAIAKFIDEMTKLATIKQAGVLKVFEAGTDAAGRTFVVTAPVEGESLAKRIEATTRLSITQICEVGRQIANALAAIHDEGVLHGELRPGCIYLLPQGGLARGEPAKVIDAGAAAAKRAVGIKIGPNYTAPEVWSANSSDWRIDAYSLGCVVYEMATGKPPYIGKSPEEVRAKHLSAPTPSARALMPDVPPTLDVMLGRLLSKNPEDRYGSMREISRIDPYRSQARRAGGEQHRREGRRRDVG
jgi:serine/threonine protein kinase